MFIFSSTLEKNSIRRQKFAPAVADFSSRFIDAGGADGFSRGRTELAPDKSTEIDEWWVDEYNLELALYGDANEGEAAFERFAWAADVNAILEMMD